MSENKQQYGKRNPLGKQLSPILVEIESAIIDMEIAISEKPCYTNEAFRAATKIFMSALMDKMYDLQIKENIPQDQKEQMAVKAGKELRKLVKTFTSIDTFELFK